MKRIALVLFVSALCLGCLREKTTVTPWSSSFPPPPGAAGCPAQEQTCYDFTKVGPPLLFGKDCTPKACCTLDTCWYNCPDWAMPK
jgi:hypothetical protein